MPKQIVIAEQLRIAALLTDERVDELIVAQGRYQIGDVFLGIVENVLPGIDAAFVNIGESEKNGFIHVTDLGPLRLRKGAAGITELLEPRQQVLVQVMKEPTGSKGPRLTGNLSLPGRYLVLQPHGQGVNISRRISAESERNRLRALGVLIKPPGNGLLIRTEAENITEELLIDDLENLLQQWEAIQQASESYTAPVLLNRDEDFIHRILRDHISPEIVRVVVEEASAVERVNKFLSQNAQNIKVEPYIGPNELLDHFRINTAINDALHPRVDLPSGGYIIIEPTEAMTVIDVNSGSFTRSANSRETVLWTNCEAAVEIARQLKLRNIGGVIIIDFIDMESRRDQLQLLEHFTSAIKTDSARPQIAQLTELGLVELTRKRQGQNIYELFGQTCPNCGGLGHITSLPGKGLPQPLATATGLVRSSYASKQEEQSPIGANNLAKRRITKNRQEIISNTSPEQISGSSLNISSNENIIENTIEPNSSDLPSHRQEPEFIGVLMDSTQEDVFSELGLNPLLLLDQIPTNENLLVRVVRPGEEVEVVLENARKQLTNTSNRRRKKGRLNSHSNRVITRNTIDDSSAIQEESITTTNPQSEGSEESSNEESSLPEESNSLENVDSIESEKTMPEDQEAEDPRRRRRRSSASTDSDS